MICFWNFSLTNTEQDKMTRKDLWIEVFKNTISNYDLFLCLTILKVSHKKLFYDVNNVFEIEYEIIFLSKMVQRRLFLLKLLLNPFYFSVYVEPKLFFLKKMGSPVDKKKKGRSYFLWQKHFLLKTLLPEPNSPAIIVTGSSFFFSARSRSCFSKCKDMW